MSYTYKHTSVLLALKVSGAATSAKLFTEYSRTCQSYTAHYTFVICQGRYWHATSPFLKLLWSSEVV